MALTEEARKARNEYKRKWNAANPEKNRLYMERYWKKKSQSDRKKAEESGTPKGGTQ